jgi:rhodanese-related sulfurtransferase
MKTSSIIPAHFLFFLLMTIGCQQSAQQVEQQNFEITDEAFDMLQGQVEDLVILDVRDSVEIREGMIPNAVHMDFYADDFDTNLTTLNKTGPIVVYCESGKRAGKTCDKLKAMGFQKVYNYGGFNRWQKQHQ